MHDETIRHTTADGSSHIGTPTSCYFVQTFCSNCFSDDQIHTTEASSSQRKYFKDGSWPTIRYRYIPCLISNGLNDDDVKWIRTRGRAGQQECEQQQQDQSLYLYFCLLESSTVFCFASMFAVKNISLMEWAHKRSPRK